MRNVPISWKAFFNRTYDLHARKKRTPQKHDPTRFLVLYIACEGCGNVDLNHPLMDGVIVDTKLVIVLKLLCEIELLDAGERDDGEMEWIIEQFINVIRVFSE